MQGENIMMEIDYQYLRPKKAEALKKWYDAPVNILEEPRFWRGKNATILPLRRDPGDQLPTPAQVALSEAESAGPGAGSRLVTAKAAENPVEWSSLTGLRAPFSFGPSTARFLFGKTKRKWGVE